MKIYTIIRGQFEPELCDHESWRELMDDGWVFVGMKNNHALMTRGGYINEFWSVD